uniref:Uncharacterized protein n=1 Tax=Rhizophora mucronata TaxID=61149 RepID=A0A2P2MKK9_RHIMU
MNRKWDHPAALLESANNTLHKNHFSCHNPKIKNKFFKLQLKIQSMKTHLTQCIPGSSTV